MKDYLKTNFRSSLSKILSIIILSTFFYFGFNVSNAVAHTPHDDVFQVQISPHYDLDRTLFTIVRGNLFKSTDEGENWQRIIKGLDHKHRLYSLAITKSSPKKLFLSTLGDGVYKSEDSGNSWFKVNSGLDNLNIDLLAVSQSDPDLILAAGKERELYQTIDGGNHWHRVINKDKISAIAFTSGSIFAGDTKGNLLISQDRGNSWQTRFNLDGEKISAIFASTSSDVILIGTEAGKIYQSFDGGVSITEILHLDSQPILSLVMTDEDATIYAVAGYQGVLQSKDKGESWQTLDGGLTADSQARELKRPYYSQLALSPTFQRDNTLFLAGYDGLFKSHNGGETWQEKETLSAKTIVGLGISPNYSHDGTVAVGTYVWGGYLSGDRGKDWHSISKDLLESQRLRKRSGISRVFDPVFSPQYRQDRTIFSTTWYGIHKSHNKGNKWQKRYWWDIQPQNEPWWTRRSQGSTIALSPAYKQDKTVYLGTMEGHILQSTNEGRDFTLIARLNAPITDLTVSPDFKRDSTLYAAVPEKIYQSRDGGHNWDLASEGIVFQDRYDPRKEAMMQLVISPNFTKDSTIFLGTAEGIFKTENKGKNWQKLTNTTYGDDSYIEGIAISPQYKSDRTSIASIRGKGLFKTTDGGNTFTPIGEELIENNITLANLFGFSLTGVSPPIQFSPNFKRDRTIFGFADKQLYKSTDGGNTWQSITIPIPDRNWLTYLYFDYLRLTLYPKLAIALTSFTALLVYLAIKLWRSRFRIRIEKFSFKA